MSIEQSYQAAAAVLEYEGLHDNRLAEVQLPAVQIAQWGERDARQTRYAVFGNIDAPHVIFETAPYLTAIDKPHYLLRLHAQQAVLGQDYAIVGVEAYHPRNKLGHAERKTMAKTGSFAPLSAGVLSVAGSLDLDDAQTKAVYGYSLGADVSIQVAYDVLHNPSRGAMAVHALGAVEPARVVNRGLGVVKAMGDSGKRLYENMMASDSPALREAWQIDLTKPANKQEKAMMAAVNKGVIGYMLAGAANNLALIRGFGTDASVRQLERITATPLPIMLGRQEGSTVCPPGVLDGFAGDTVTILDERGNDHSADDNIARSAGRMLHFATVVE